MAKHIRCRFLTRSCALRACVALLICVNASVASADTFCVHTADELRSAFTTTSTGGSAANRANVVHLASGTYAAAGATFLYTNASSFPLTLDGGYDATCANQDRTVNATVLDGGGTVQTLALQSAATLTVRQLTIQNGSFSGGDGGGAQVYLSGSAGSLLFDANVVRNNTDDFAVAGLVVFGSGTAHISNSLFYGNHAPGVSALAVDATSAWLTNDTFSANVCDNPATCVTVSMGSSATTIIGYVSNSISYGNTAGNDFYLYVNNSVTFHNNDYGSINGSPSAASSANVSVDPLFVGSGNYHLQSTSPVLNIGTLNPPGGLPLRDIAGHPRTFARLVDLGVHQHGDGIFTNGFEQ